VLSGGAINSPQLLMLSGIGPRGTLREHGIDVAVHLPGVGENLHDHPAAGVIWHTKGTTDLIDYQTTSRLMQWQLAGRGPLASNVGEAGGFTTTRTSTHPTCSSTWRRHSSWTTAYASRPAAASRRRRRWSTWPAEAAAPTLGQPELAPRHRPGVLHGPADWDAMLAGCRMLIEIGRQPAIARFLAAPTSQHTWTASRTTSWASTSASSPDALTTRSARARWAPANSRGRSGVAGTRRGRPTGRGRVGDAKVVRGNTNAPTIMIAEKRRT